MKNHALALAVTAGTAATATMMTASPSSSETAEETVTLTTRASPTTVTASPSTVTASPPTVTADDTVTLTLTETTTGTITVQLAGDVTVITGAWEQETVIVVTPGSDPMATTAGVEGTTTVTSALVQTVTDTASDLATPTTPPDADTPSDGAFTEEAPTKTAAIGTDSASTLPGSPTTITSDSAGVRLSPLNFKIW